MTTTHETEDGVLLVTVTSADAQMARNHGSVISIVGTDDEGRTVRFAGDHRPCVDLIEALLAEDNDLDEVTVAVEGWQILGVSE